MLYEQYEKRIKFVAKIKHIIYNLRFIILGVTVFAVSGTTTLNLVKGTVDEEYNIPSEIVYGESYTPKASATMNKAHVEFAQENTDEWTINAPIFAGQYKARGYSLNGYGAKTYGKVFHYTIKRKPIDIQLKQTTITYGQKLSIDTAIFNENKAYNDSIANFSYTYEGEDLYDKKAFVVEDDFKIVNDSGLDVTSNYDINYVKTDLHIDKKNLTINFKSNSKEYDGESLNGQYENTPLVEGDTLSFTKELTSLTNIDKVANNMSENDIVIVNEKNETVTPYYNIVINSGTLEVTQRTLNLKSFDVNRTYNGHGLTDDSENPELKYQITSGSLMENHYLDVKFANYGTYESINTKNEFTAIVREKGSDNDVSELYNIRKTEGNILITKQSITLASPSMEVFYDGQALQGLYDNDEKYISKGKLAETDSLSYDKTVSITEPGQVNNYLDFKINNSLVGDSFDASKCYDITTNYGDLVVNKIPLPVASNDVDREYNGKALTSEEGGELYASYDSTKILTNLGHKVNLSFSQENRIDCVNSVTNFFNFSITDKDGNDVTDVYYDVDRRYGTISIAQKPITIRSNNKSIVYNGSPLSLTESDIEYDELGELDAFVFNSATNSVTKPTDGSVKGTIDYQIIHDGVKDVTSNYKITDNLGNLSVNRIKLTISTNSLNKVYDGVNYSRFAAENENKLTYDVVSSNASGLLPQHELHVSFDYEGQVITPNGEAVENHISYGIYEKDSTIPVEDYADYYDISEDFGDIQISKRPITISSNDGSKVYDGTPLQDSDLTVTGLLDQDQVTYSGTIFSQTDYTKGVDNTFSYNITNKYTGDDVSSCYDATIHYGTFVVNKRAIVVDMPGGSITYDGYSHSLNVKNVMPTISPESPNSLADNDVISTICNKSVVDAKSYVYGTDYDVSNYRITILNGADEFKDVSINYDILYSYAPIEISKRSVELTINTTYASKTFDGKSLLTTNPLSSFFNIPEGACAYSDELITNNPENDPVAPCSGTIVVQFHIQNKSTHKNVSDNYKININEIQISYEITKASSITLVTKNAASKMYDGTVNKNGSLGLEGGLSLALQPKGYTCSSGSYMVGEYYYEVNVDNLYFQSLYDMTTYQTNDLFDTVIILNEGKSSITKRNIKFGFKEGFYEFYNETSMMYQIPYDGSMKSYEGDYLLIGGAHFADGDEYSLVVTKEENTASQLGVATTFGFDVEDIKITNNGEDRTSCYNITTEKNPVVVDKSKITITSESNEFVFNNGDIHHDYYSTSLISSNLDIELDWSIENVGSRKNVGTYDNTFKTKKLSLHDTGEDVTEWYEVTEVYGKIEIRPFTILYNTNVYYRTYDGTGTYISSNVKVGTAGNVYFVNSYDYDVMSNFGYKVYVNFDSTEFIYSGTYYATPHFVVYDENGAINENNVVVYPYGSSDVLVYIDRRNLVLTNNYHGKVERYYGDYEDGVYTDYDPISCPILIGGNTSLASGDMLITNGVDLLNPSYRSETMINIDGQDIIVVTYSGAMLNAAISEYISNGSIYIENSEGVNVTNCYNIGSNFADITIYYYVI